jgi:SAM-dependent methyltransferase
MIARLLQALKPWPRHPIDRQYGIETSRRFRAIRIRVGDAELDDANIGYVGSHPSVVRAALGTLPDLTGAAFYDLGCGKGRVLAIATDIPFASITGIELSPGLAAKAQRNVERMVRRRTPRAVPQIITGDATSPALVDNGLIVIYLYNPFKAPLVARLLDHLSEHLHGNTSCRLFLVYYNPVHASVVDAHVGFERYHARRYPLTPEEVTASPWKGQRFDSLAIWQARTADTAAPLADANRPIKVLKENVIAEVAED